MSRTQIGIAVVEHEGTYLVGTRGPDGPLPGLDEFPGGKCHADESPDTCARRECLEETGLDVDAVELLVNRQHDYEHATVDLYFWRCRPRDPSKVASDHRGYRWVPATELAGLKFPPANEEVLAILSGQPRSGGEQPAAT